MAAFARGLRSTARRRYEGSIAWRLVHPRRIHVFCVGAGKTGTHSIAGMFDRHYRTAHEPETELLIEVILAEAEGRMSASEVAAWLRRRDRRLWLEMDASGLNGAVVRHLVGLFPEARFILTVRDCHSWLDSLLDHHLTRPTTDSWRRLRDLRCPPAERRYTRTEEILRENGLFPIGAYLKQWAAHNRAVLEAVPPERLLVVRTERIGESVDRLAAFLGIPADTIDRSQAHLYRRATGSGILAKIDPRLVEERIAEHCAELMRVLFEDPPGTTTSGPWSAARSDRRAVGA